MSNPIVRLLVTEKTTELAEQRKYTFLVEGDLDKGEIARQVTTDYSVIVESVNTVTQSSKSRRTRTGTVVRRRPRKAIVTLAKGYSIPLA